MTMAQTRSTGGRSGDAGRETRSIPAGTASLPEVCPPAPSRTRTARCVASIPSSTAKADRATLIATVLTVGRWHHQLCPVVGRTKASTERQADRRWTQAVGRWPFGAQDERNDDGLA